MLSPLAELPTLNITFYRTSSIGDVVLATICLDFLKKSKLKCKIYWIGDGSSLNLLKNSWVDVHFIKLHKASSKKDFIKIANLIQDTHILIDLQNNIRSKLLIYTLYRTQKNSKATIVTTNKDQALRYKLLLKAKLRGRQSPLVINELKPKKFVFTNMLNSLIKALKVQLPSESIEYCRTIVAHPNLPDISKIKPLDYVWLKEINFNNWLAIAPGASHATKTAPLSVFAEILNRFKDCYPKKNLPRIIFLGSTQERQLCLQLIEQINWPSTPLNLCGSLSLFESSIALRNCVAVLCNDSSLTHLAEAVDTDALVLFGPTIESFGFKPWRQNSRSFSAKLGCRPCSKHGKTTCRFNDMLCFKDIDTQEVSKHLIYLFDKNNNTESTKTKKN